MRELAGVAELLARTDLEMHQAQMVQRIVASAERLSEFVTPQGGVDPGLTDKPAMRAKFGTPRAIAVVIRSVAPLAEALGGGKLIARTDELTGALPLLDENKMIQVVTALLLDAILQCRGGEIRLNARTLRDSSLEASNDRRPNLEEEKAARGASHPMEGGEVLKFIYELSAKCGGWIRMEQSGDEVLRTSFLIDGADPIKEGVTAEGSRQAG